MENLEETSDPNIDRLKKSNFHLKIVVGVMAFLCALFFVYALVQKGIAEENLVLASINSSKAMEERRQSNKCAEEARKLQQMAERNAEAARLAQQQAEEVLRKFSKK